LEFLSDKKSLLLLVDYQPTSFKSVSSGDRIVIKGDCNQRCISGSHTWHSGCLSSINPNSMGEFIPEITSPFPDQTAFARKNPSFDAIEDEGTLNAVKKIGRKEARRLRIMERHVFCVYSNTCPQRGVRGLWIGRCCR